ncbi:MAG: hypothetical protein Q8K30_01925 [Candidatus Gracilibacteria bacterium]|nr:hypothetical protein [Candidatus Gracilibacteria bacterium]
MSNLSFVVYVLTCLVFAYGQAMKMLDSNQGVVISMFIANCFFFIFMTKKAFNIWNNTKSFFNLKIFIVYILALLTYSLLIFIIVSKEMENSWKYYDTINVISITSAFIILFITVKVNTIKNLLGAVVKGIPQLTFAITIWQEGNLGVSLEMIIAFHILTLPRCFQNYQLWKSNKTDKNKKTMFISEVVNESTWMIVTIAFFTTGKARINPRFFSFHKLIPYIFSYSF